jgi:hypothetical protein
MKQNPPVLPSATARLRVPAQRAQESSEPESTPPRARLSRDVRVGSVIAIATAGVLVALYLATRAADISFTDLSRDPAATLDGPWYTGAVSTSAITLLIVGAGIALFVVSLLPTVDGRSRKGLLGGLSLIVLVVAADDLFMLHEEVFPLVGINTVMFSAIYGIALLAVLWWWREVVGSTDWVFLLLAALGMGFSVAIDVVLETGLVTLPVPGELVEDPAKILGMIFMSFYLVVTAREALFGELPAGLPAPK